MNPHDWFVENRSAFVARTLEPEEEKTFADHLRHCSDCTEAVERLQRELAWLPMGIPPVAPRPGLSRRLAGDILDPPRRWRRRLPALAAAAALMLAAGITLTARQERRHLEGLLATREQRLMALEDTLSVLREAQQVQQASILMNGHRGGLLIFQDAVSHRWVVIVHGLPPAPSGNVYQFWFITQSGMVRSVEVNPDTARPAFMTVSMPKVKAPVMGAALTVEPMVNRSPEPRGLQLAHLVF
jgi:Anti-sigma-K factor rskA